MAFDPKDLNAYKEFLNTQQKISETISKGTKSFAVGAKDALKAANDLRKVKKDFNRLEKEEAKLQKELNNLQGEELRIAEERLKVIRAEKKATEDILKKQEALSKALSSQVGSVKNIALALGRDTAKALTKVTKKAVELGKEFSENDDAIRRTAVNIGVMGKQFDMVRKNAYKAALVTQRIGVDAKELVESYGSYVDEVGRLIPLSVSAGKAMAFMSKGTVLGSQGAAQMAASMEVFGMSIESTAGYVGDVVNMSEKIGVSSGKTLKILQQNLRKAQTVRFKGGVDGMAKMAAKSAALRMDMSATLDLANQLFEPEKAIETAATLQMMGGAFARMADPIQLMFNARNNPAKLMEDLSAAAGSVAKNMGDGTYDIPAMELQKLQEIAKQTGLSYEGMVEAAKTSARRNDIGKMLNPRIKDENRDFIKSIAEFKDGTFKVQVDGKYKKISDLSAKQVERMMSQDATLKKRAEEAQGFMTTLQNLFKSLKNLGMSFFSGLDSTLGPALRALTGTGEGTLASASERFYQAGQDFGTFIKEDIVPFVKEKLPTFISMVKTIGEKAFKAVYTVGGFIKNTLMPGIAMVVDWAKSFWSKNEDLIKGIAEASIMIGSAVGSLLRGINKYFGTGGLIAAILLVKFPKIIGGLLSSIVGIGRASKGVPQSVFVVNPGGMGPGGMSPGGGAAGGAAAMAGGRAAAGKVGGKGLKGVLGRLGPKMGKAMGPLALVSIGADVGRMFMDNPDSNMGKALGVAGTTAGDAAMGMMLGSVLGPMGTAVGGILGGIVGFGRSMYKEMNTKGIQDYDMGSAKSNVQSNKLSMSSSSFMADGAVLPNGNVIKTAKGEMYSLAPKDVVSIGQPGGSSSGTVGGNVSVNISGTINLNGGDSSISLDSVMNDPTFKSEITKIVVKGMREQNR